MAEQLGQAAAQLCAPGVPGARAARRAFASCPDWMALFSLSAL